MQIGSTSFNSIIKQLLPSTTYYVKAYAKNSIGLSLSLSVLVSHLLLSLSPFLSLSLPPSFCLPPPLSQATYLDPDMLVTCLLGPRFTGVRHVYRRRA